MKNIKWIFVLCFSVLFSILSYSAELHLQSQGILEKVAIERLPDHLEVNLHLTQKTNFNSFLLEEPNRLVIDLFQVERFSNSPQIEVSAFGLNKIRTGINRPGVVRVVFDLQDRVPHYEIGEEGSSIKIEIWYELKPEPAKLEVAPVKKEKLEEKKDVEKLEAKKEIEKLEMKKEVEQPEEKKETEKLEKKKAEAKVKEPEVPQKIPLIKAVEVASSSRDRSICFGLHAGYFMFQSRELRDFFGTGITFPGAEIGVEFPFGLKSFLGLMCSFNFLRAEGQGEYDGTKAKFSNSPVLLTLVYLREFDKLMPFAGIGLEYNYYRLTYPEEHQAEYNYGVVWGGVLQVGANYLFSNKLRIRIVYNYHYATASEDIFDVVLGGNEFIMALSYGFGF
ncbi:AMIN domain-containing protein [Acidobacteriota bacterium]